MLAFSLSLLGTFLVRSGVLTSVHAFATDPARGVFILLFLLIVIGGSLLLYAFRAPNIKSAGGFQLLSRETLLLCNNVLLVVVTATILLGTLYPLFLDALGLGKISVGPPYFNSVFVPLSAVIAILMGIGPVARWKQNDPTQLGKQLILPAGVSIALGIAFTVIIYDNYPFMVILGMILAFWIVVTILNDLRNRLAAKPDKFQVLLKLPRSYYSMTVAHFGIAVFIVGITLTSHYSVERDVRMTEGATLQLAGYDFNFVGVDKQQGPNYETHLGVVKVSKDGEEIVTLHPEKRYYFVQQNPMTEAAIDAGLFRDIYISLGEPLPDGKAWAVRIYYKPFIRWIWLGALIMAFGGLLAATDKRYRVLLRRQAKLDTTSAALAKA